MTYACKVCKKELCPASEDFHLTPKEDGSEGYDAYCARCWSELDRWAGSFGFSVMEEGEKRK